MSTTRVSIRITRSLAAAGLVALVLPFSAGAPAVAEDAAYSGFRTEVTATPLHIEIYEPTVPIPASPQFEFHLGYSKVEADTASSAGRASYLWPGDSIGEGAKTIIENLHLPEEISKPLAAEGYPFQVNSVAPSDQEQEADEPFPGMVMRTSASAEKTFAQTGYSTDCQVEPQEQEGDDGGETPGLPGLPELGALFGVGDDGSEAQQDTKAAQGKQAKQGKAEEPEESCRIPAELAALVDFGGYVSTSRSTNDGSTVATTARSALSDVELLGGLITVSGLHATSTASSDGRIGDPGGKAKYGTLAIDGQEFALGPDGVEGGGHSEPIPGLPDDPKKALAQLGVTITVPEPVTTRDGDRAVSELSALVVELDTTQLRSMLDDIPFDDIVDQVPDEAGELKSLLGAAVHLSPRFVFTLASATTAVDTVQGIELPTSPTTPNGSGGENTDTSGPSGGGGGGGGGAGGTTPDVPVAAGPQGGVPSDVDGNLDAEPTAAGLPPLNSIPGALTVGGIAAAAAAGSWLRKIGVIALGGAGSCPHGLDSGLPDLRKA